ncbi:subtilisin family serine protease [Kibdelosporangium banguiense]|uniref:Subtilisin family serine protease n=1 Tax=Kibdelosporangium banguiense TaxID=1365924 RepID=A0ABS4TV85_9PSEU|nr:S8 family serine peptidase [Kibdelosporangium banguiense]MBP2327836.1 subtilisin family serine protease [Kibdelosporangium banguiense]
MTAIRRRLVLALTGVLIAGTAIPANAEPADDPPAGNVVTLITGDKVSVTEFGAGRRAVAVTPGKNRSDVTFYKQSQDGGDVTIIPSDVVGLLHDGTLDPRLFNVTGLIRDRFDDAHSASLPLIITHTADRRPVALAQADGATDQRALASIDATAVGQRRDRAVEFWAGIAREPAAALESGIRKVWLDARYEAVDDVGNVQIGVPAAHEAGYTGTGVKVAVLDTGWDYDHPDLQGLVIDERSFGLAKNANDDNGHGTHVAGIIAGSGSASGGRYAGVAPDVDLLIGKVLDDSGSGSASQIIAGMEWAVAAGADIVNMSLGSRFPSDGTDVMSQAVNALSRQSDTLFVVAAGNSGPGATTVAAPAAADAALTVGAVDSASVIAPFSSRGPRLGDGAVKPEITAPGVNVIAPRAKGTPIGDVDPEGPMGPINDNYTALSGTSMAAPSVAGAAALVAQQHPGWDGERLKAALTSTASPQSGQDVFMQGNGLTDLARAVRQPVTAEPASLAMGFFAWPHKDKAPVTKTVTYRNDGTVPVSLRITSTPTTSVPAGLLRLSVTEIAVPPHGTSTVDVTLTPSAGVTTAGGDFGWRLVAASADGLTRLQTTAGTRFETESYDFTFTAIDRNGNTPRAPYQTFVMADPIDRKGASTFARVDTINPKATLRLPKGRYGLTAITTTVTNGVPTENTLESRPRVTLDRHTTLEFDARKGKPVSVGVASEEKVTPTFAEMGGLHTGAGETAEFGAWRPYFSKTAFSAVPTPFWERDSSFRYYYRTTLVPPQDDVTTPIAGPTYSLLEDNRGGVPDRLSYDVPVHSLAKVDAWYGKRAGSLNNAAYLVAGFAPGQVGSTAMTVVRNVPIPSRRVEYYSPGASWAGMMSRSRTPDGTAYYSLGRLISQPRTYPVGRVTTEMWNYAVDGPALAANGQFLTRAGDRITPAFALWGDSNPNHYNYNDRPFTRAKATLYRDGVAVGTVDRPWEDEENFAGPVFWTVPDKQASYRLDVTATRDASWHGPRSQRIEASWTFRSGHTDATTPLPVTVVRFQPPTDGNGVATAGTRFKVPFTVQQQGTKRQGIDKLTVEASYDNGTTWTRVPSTIWGASGKAELTHPAGPGWVSLRVAGTDTAGNTFSQTVIQAYQLA